MSFRDLPLLYDISGGSLLIPKGVIYYMVQKFPLLEVVQACHSLLIPTKGKSEKSIVLDL